MYGIVQIHRQVPLSDTKLLKETKLHHITYYKNMIQ